MNATTLAALAVFAGLGSSVWLLAIAARPVVRRRLDLPRLHISRRTQAAVAVGIVVAVLTRWPVAALAAAALVRSWPWLFGGGHAAAAAIERLEALAGWTESLKDTIAGAIGLEEAIPATAPAAGPSLRPHVDRLVERLRAREPLPDALSRFADDLNDPSADLVVAALLLNAGLRGPGLRATLEALAASARDELDLRRKIEAERRTLRTGAKIIVGITVGFVAALTALDSAYLRPYDTATGQLVLVLVVGVFAAAFAWLRTLGTATTAPRLLAHTDCGGSAVTAAIVVFAGLGAAVTGLLVLLLPTRPGLLAAIGRLDAARTAAPAQVVVGHGLSWTERQAQLGHLLGDRLAPLLRPGRSRHDPAGHQGDLAITDREDDLLIGLQVVCGLIGFLALPTLALVLTPTGLRLPGGALLIGSPLLAAGLAFLPHLQLRRDAETRRAEFRRALSCYLDLVAMSMAGGRGAPQALSEAAALSDGWAHRLIGDALATSRLSGTNPWHGLGELGRRIGVPELCELAGALALVGDHGARVRDTLTARAATLRRRALTDAEGNAAQADQKMRIAQVLLAFGFLILIAYPALAAVLAL